MCTQLLHRLFEGVALANRQACLMFDISSLWTHGSQAFLGYQQTSCTPYCWGCFFEALEKKEWFGGDHLTAADIALIYPIESAKERFYLDVDYPNCLTWLERVHSCESFKAAQAKDGRESIALKV